MNHIDDLIAAWDGHAVITRFDRPTGTWIFIAIHDATLGMPSGGTRMRLYSSPAAGLLDAMRLAEGMTYKWASIGFDFGGGKAVLAVSRPLEGEERDGLLCRYGQLLSSLKGAFGTGVDLGTSARDMAVVGRHTRWVHGVDGDGNSIDPGPFTARGVFAGLRAAVHHRFGSAELSGRSVLVQGVGGVGGPLARSLAAAGAEVLVSDIDSSRAESFAAEIAATPVPAEDVFATPCDVFAPCAVGAILNRESIAQLRCALVAGSANNQLESRDDAERLHARGILYAPDYVINAGGALSFAMLGRGATVEEVLPRLDALGETLTEIFAEARAESESPLWAAERRAERRLERGRTAARAAEAEGAT